MIERIEMGPTPASEGCEQVGTPDYAVKGKAECRRWRDGLAKMFPRAEFAIVSNRHDFGTYYEVAALYDDEDEESIKNALEAEDGAPATWEELERTE
jgi:hypothetical protein